MEVFLVFYLFLTNQFQAEVVKTKGMKICLLFIYCKSSSTDGLLFSTSQGIFLLKYSYIRFINKPPKLKYSTDLADSLFISTVHKSTSYHSVQQLLWSPNVPELFYCLPEQYWKYHIISFLQRLHAEILSAIHQSGVPGFYHLNCIFSLHAHKDEFKPADLILSSS